MCRWGRIALVVVLIASFFLNTAPSVSAAVQLTHYTYEAHGDFWRQFLELMAERFKASTGISVEFIVASGSEYRAKLMTMIAGGVPPDVTDAHPMLGAPLIAQGVFEDLTPYVKRDNFPIDQMPPVAVEGVMTPDRKLWGIPGSVYPVVTFFNADLFAEAGIPNPRELGENWTWETLISSARALTRDRDGDGVFETYGTSRISYRWEMQVHQAGGQLYDRVVYPTKSQFNTPEVLRRGVHTQSLCRQHSHQQPHDLRCVPRYVRICRGRRTGIDQLLPACRLQVGYCHPAQGTGQPRRTSQSGRLPDCLS